MDLKETTNFKNISIIIPWRNCGQKDRNRIFEFCYARYQYLFPRAEIILTDSDDEVFSRGKSINKGAKECKGDYLIITDADYLFSPTMAKEIVNKQPWTVAVKQENYFFLNDDITYRILNKYDFDVNIKDIDFGNSLTPSSFPTYGQLMAMPRENFVRFDESMSGYGWEDQVYWICMKACHGKEFRTNNKMYHMFHRRPINSKYMQKSYDNKNYYDKVWKPIENDKKAIRKLMQEKGMIL